MATQFTFNNQVIELPGSYSNFQSGVTNPPLSLSYGNVLIIDTGISPEYGAGSGISGQLASGAKSLYQANKLADFRRAIGGGILWDIAESLFQPNGPGGGNGVSKLFYTRAAHTTPSEVVLDYVSNGNGGTAILKAKNEGLVGNGVKGDQVLSTCSWVVNVPGNQGDSHTIEVTDPKYGQLILGQYVVQEDDTSEDVAYSLVQSINAGNSNYNAVQNGATVVVTSRTPEGLESPEDFNGISTDAVTTGAAHTDPGTFTGGVSGTTLTRGYSVTLSKGVDNPDLLRVQLWRGTYKGKDENGFEWDGIKEKDTQPTLIATSPEVSSIQELHEWFESDTLFGSNFRLHSKSVVGTGELDDELLTLNSKNNLFHGGVINYTQEDLDLVLEHVQNLDYSLVLALDYGDNSQSMSNNKILAHLADGTTFGDKLMFIGGGDDESKFRPEIQNSSCQTSIYYNSDRVYVCHGGPTKDRPTVADGFISRTSLHKAAVLCGRTAGLPPQIPLTFKTVKIDGERHLLSTKEQKIGLRHGVLMTYPDNNLSRVVQGVSSIQNNRFLINPDASTHSLQLRRMIAQVNKELEANATEQLLKNPNGTNRNTLSESDIKGFVEGYLRSRTATTTSDNMIISFRNVNVILDNDAYKVTYDVIFNTEITKLFFTGTVFLNF